MPAYGTLVVPPALYPGDSYTVFNNEQPTTGETSERVALSECPDGSPKKVAVELVFSGAPGAFEFDLVTSTTDNVNDYVVSPVQITTVDANNVARAELTGVVANFAALYCKAQTANAVNVTAKITR